MTSSLADDCPDCSGTIDLVRVLRRALACRCGAAYEPLRTVVVTEEERTSPAIPEAARACAAWRHPWRPGDPAQDLAALVGHLPDLVARSPVLLRVASWTAGPSAGALAGRPDRIDQDRSHARAVACWRWLRALIAAGEGEAVAVLWCGWAAIPLAIGERGVVLGGPAQADRAARAVALGAADGPTREGWRTEAHRGPSVASRAAAWGAERLGVLWSPAPVPEALGRHLALGFAPSELRERWGGLRSRVVREREVLTWGAERLRAATEVYHECTLNA